MRISTLKQRCLLNEIFLIAYHWLWLWFPSNTENGQFKNYKDKGEYMKNLVKNMHMKNVPRK